MVSRSLGRRIARRSAAAPTPEGIVVTVQLKDFATGVSQSFLIMPGQPVSGKITGYIQGGDDRYPRVVSVPLTVDARLS